MLSIVIYDNKSKEGIRVSSNATVALRRFDVTVQGISPAAIKTYGNHNV